MNLDMSQQRHIIKRQVLELAVPKNQNTYQFQEAVSRICRSRLTPIIDELCNSLSSSDVVHRIESIELDLGKIPLDRLEEALTKSFKKSLGIQLAEAITGASRGSSKKRGTDIV